MTFPEEIITKTKQFGVLGYPLSKCVNILDFDTPADCDTYKKAFQDKESDIAKAYQKGKDMADFAFDSKLFEMAHGGNMQAMKEFDKRKNLNKIRQ